MQVDGDAQGQSGSTPPAASETDMWPFKEALQTRRIVLVEDCSALIAGYPTMVWDELPNAAVVVPIANDSDEGIPSAVIVIGLSIRRPFDEDYESFLVCLSGLSGGPASLTYIACPTVAARLWYCGRAVLRSGETAHRRAGRLGQSEEHAVLQCLA
jgi:hypothetical protein